MKRRQLLVGGGTVATAALAGCIGSAQTESGSSGDDRTLTVSKSGTVDAEPDLALVEASIEATGDDAGAVRDELSNRSDRLYDGLVDSGIGAEQITTGRFSIRERVDRRRTEQAADSPQSEGPLDEYRYYEGTHSFSIEIDDIEAVGEVIDTAVDSGADSIGRVEFTLSDEKRASLREEALESAIADARSEAEFVAGEVDATVSDVKMVDTSEGRVSTVRADVAYAEAGDAASTELRPDDITVRATARVTYTIS